MPILVPPINPRDPAAANATSAVVRSIQEDWKRVLGGRVNITDLLLGEVAGYKVYFDTLRYIDDEPGPADNTPAPEGEEVTQRARVWLVSFTGQTSAARAVWANLVDRRAAVRVGERDSVLSGDAVGWKGFSGRLAHSRLHILMVPPCTDLTLGDELGDLLVVDREGRDPATTLVYLLHRRSAMPVHLDWKDAIWDWALESGAGRELAGFGPRAWLFQTSDAALLNELGRFVGGRA